MRGAGQGIAAGQQNLVEAGQRRGLRFGNHEVAAQEPDRVFHVAFLMPRIGVAIP